MQINGNRISIVIIHDEALIREALVRSLREHSEFAVVGEAEDSRDGADEIVDKCADVALFHLDLGDQASIAMLDYLIAHCPKTRVLLLTAVIETSIARKALELGVAGIFHHGHGVNTLIKAIEKVYDGEVWMDRSVIAAALNEIRRGSTESDALSCPGASELTPREFEVIGLVCEGLRTRDMAERLFISEKTVRNHLASIFNKLDVTHRLELSVLARKHGLAPDTSSV